MRRVSDDRGIFDKVRGLHNKKGDIVLFLLALKNFFMVTSLDHCQDKKELESSRGETWRGEKETMFFFAFRSAELNERCLRSGKVFWCISG